jgi:hypothetical protein
MGKDVRIRDYFSKPKGDREQNSLENIALDYVTSNDGMAVNNEGSGGVASPKDCLGGDLTRLTVTTNPPPPYQNSRCNGRDSKWHLSNAFCGDSKIEGLSPLIKL